jgi:Concanavalin A-like lectin/glucanases superfamily
MPHSDVATDAPHGDNRRARTAGGGLFRRLALHALCACGPSALGCSDEVYVHLLAPEPTSDETAVPTETAQVTEPMESTDGTATATAPEVDAAAAEPNAAADAAANTDEPTVNLDAAPLTAAALLHHYDFSGTGTAVIDRVGSADGVVLGGATLDGAGGVTLDGLDDYVDLPNGLLGDLEAVTFVVWLTWHGGPCWQRVFDFGNSLEEDVPSRALTSVFVTPSSCSETHAGPVEQNVLSAMFHVGGSAFTAGGNEALQVDVAAHVALVVSPTAGLALYFDGNLVAESLALPDLTGLEETNVWLGRSQWGQDASLAARLDDFRLYAGALDAAQVQSAFATGP